MRYFFFFLIFGCSLNPVYKVTDIDLELKNNCAHLDSLSTEVKNDFRKKKLFLKHYYQLNKSGFLLEDLAFRLTDLEMKKNSILGKSDYLKKVYEDLLFSLSRKVEISKSDPEFDKLNYFSKFTKTATRNLLTEYENYQISSAGFAQFSVLIGKTDRRNPANSR